jgi:hypothetical protein
MRQRLSHLEELSTWRSVRVKCALPWVLRLSSLQSTLLFLLPLWKTLGFGTAMPMTMVKTMTKSMMRSKRSLSEDVAFPSLFLVLDAKEGEEVLSI